MVLKFLYINSNNIQDNSFIKFEIFTQKIQRNPNKTNKTNT